MEAAALNQLSQRLQKWVLEAASTTRQQLKQPLEIATKSGPNDLVTNVDRANQAFLVERIKEAYPTAQIVGEEGRDVVPTNWTEGLAFFIDPIDGTLNFVKQQSHFAIMIGVYLNGQPLFGVIYDVMADQILWGGPHYGVFMNETQLPAIGQRALSSGLISLNTYMLAKNVDQMHRVYQASAGVRIYGSAGIVFSELLQGHVIAYISKLAPWDIAAGRVLAETLGFQVLDLQGQPISMLAKQGMIIAPNPAMAEILGKIRMTKME